MMIMDIHVNNHDHVTTLVCVIYCQCSILRWFSDTWERTGGSLIIIIMGWLRLIKFLPDLYHTPIHLPPIYSFRTCHTFNIISYLCNWTYPNQTKSLLQDHRVPLGSSKFHILYFLLQQHNNIKWKLKWFHTWYKWWDVHSCLIFMDIRTER